MPPRYPVLALSAVALLNAGVAFLAAGVASAQSTERVSVSSTGAQADGESGDACVSTDGRVVGFWSFAANLVPNDTNGMPDVFVHDRASGATTRVDVDSSGAQADSYAGDPALSGDGRFIAFYSAATNLVPGDTNGADDVFVHDRVTGLTSRVSLGANGVQSNGSSGLVAISSGGRCVGFGSAATNLVAGDTNGAYDLFVHDRLTGATTRVSVASSGAEADDDSDFLSLSADGRFAAFLSHATNLVPADTNGDPDVFVHDLATGITTRESVGPNGAEADGFSWEPAISADARFVAFTSHATNLAPGGVPFSHQAYVRDRMLGENRMVSVTPAGSPGSPQTFYLGLAISADGRFVSFGSEAGDLVAGDTNGTVDLFSRDLAIGFTRRVNVGSNGQQTAIGWGEDFFLAADGRICAFISPDPNVVPGDTNGQPDIFVHDFGSETIAATCFGDGSTASCPCGNAGIPRRGCENSDGTGGAKLTAAGNPGLSSDSLVLTSSGETSTALTVFFQGDEPLGPQAFGDGLRCVGGSLVRLYVRVATAGVAIAPQAGEPSISARSGAAGDRLSLGTTRYYQAYYRDPSGGFCPPPAGDLWNASDAVIVTWGP